jgi:hypothetical protein
MLERRKAQRSPTRAAGSVAFGRGPDIECLVRNISSGGACLVFARRRTRLPKDFALNVDEDLSRRSCRLVWRSGFRAGVRFVSGR